MEDFSFCQASRRIHTCHASWVLVVVGALFPVGRAKGGESALYERKATWQETMLVARENVARARASSSDEDNLWLGPWHTTGPLEAKRFGDALFPENGVDLARAGGGGKPAWEQRAQWADGVVIDLPGGKSKSTYVYRLITARRATSITASLGSDDGIEVWLRGKKLFSLNVGRGAAPDQNHLELNLARGKNELLLKIHNTGGGHGFYFALDRSKLLPLWRRLEADFPTESAWMKGDLGSGGYLRWFQDPGTTAPEREMIGRAVKGAGLRLRGRYRKLCDASPDASDRRWLDLYVEVCRSRDELAALGDIDPGALRLAIHDLMNRFPARYGGGAAYLRRLDALEASLAAGDGEPGLAAKLVALRREALLANPLLDFDRLLVLKRNFGKNANRVMSRSLGMPGLNSYTNENIERPGSGWDNEIVVLSDLRGRGRIETLYKPSQKKIITDTDVDFDASRIMFSSIGTHGRWHVFEIGADGSGLRQLTPEDLPAVDHFDSCYLPDGNIVFTSTATFQGLPCEGGAKAMAVLYVLDRARSKIRQLTFEQDSDWCPTVLNNGRLMYLRWEYTDSPHYFTRLLFHANPDGTGQMEYYGSNSYFPNAFFYARPIPGHSTKVVGIVGGHHGISRSGRLLILDPARGRHEADGVVQEIPGRGLEVKPIIRDALVDGVWPQFLHPFPLSDTHFLVSAKRDGAALWGIYLVDTFDHMVLLKEVEGSALLEPFPIERRTRPPVIPSKVHEGRKDATVYLYDAQLGPGLAGLPRGIVKKLRLFTYHFGYNQTGGHDSVGVESSWDVKRILGTVPVESDGSAIFTVPANMPIALQPLDDEGRALQLMRSWFVAMPGEVLSCVGCHEQQNMAPPSRPTIASRRAPSRIEPWHGDARPFAFPFEVQPVLDDNCVKCHDGRPSRGGVAMPDFRRSTATRFQADEAYLSLHPFVRRPGPESDYHLLKPMEYHASTSELIQMLAKGHHGVQLGAEAWDRLYTWIDLNAPWRGKWSPNAWRNQDQRQRRLVLSRRYAGTEIDPEAEYDRLAAQTAPPQQRPVTRARADDPDDADTVLGPGDTITITFGVDTNRPALVTGDKGGLELDRFFALTHEHSFGAADRYTLRWTNARTLRITVRDHSAASVAIGDEITVKDAASITTAEGRPLDEDSARCRLRGDWGGGLVAHWGLDETRGAAARDASGSGRSGSLRGAFTSRWTRGRVGGALHFDGAGDHVDCGSGPGSAAALTVSFWMKVDGDRFMIPVDKLSRNGTAGWTIKLRPRSQGAALWFRIGSESANSTIAVDKAYKRDVWLHVACTYADGAAKVFLDGAGRTEKSGIPQTVANTTTPLRLGVPAEACGGEQFAGLLDDVRIYDRALTAAEVKTLYETRVPPPAPAASATTARNRDDRSRDRRRGAVVRVSGWPFGPADAVKRQRAAGARTKRSLDLGGGRRMDLVLIPAGEFAMGSDDGYADERPVTRVGIARPFWMGVHEVTNAQYAAFDPTHDSRYIDQQWKDHTTPGYPANRPGQPVIRITWRQAVAYCVWLSEKARARVRLPTESEWEWACRAGTASPFSYGGLDTDFSKSANLADRSVKLLAVSGVNPRPIANPNRLTDFTPKDVRFDDGAKIVTDVGAYAANAWGLYDMHGNVAEWTLTEYRPYPYVGDDGRDEPAPDGMKVARGGSWRDRPKRARSAFRLAYRPFQPVANVGFRVVICDE